MPLTSIELPILARFLCAVESTTGMPPQPLDATPEQRDAAARNAQLQTQNGEALPKGVVLGPDGKPCRTCTSAASWKLLTQRAKNIPSESTSSSSSTSSSTTSTSSFQSSSSSPRDCPADVEQLGRSAWTLLHSITATYPERPSFSLQSETRSFISTFSKLYPCWVCADDFQAWLKQAGNAPRVSSRDEFGRWMCEAHNAVNVKLGKSEFDCGRWEERWRTGWKDGRCD